MAKREGKGGKGRGKGRSKQKGDEGDRGEMEENGIVKGRQKEKRE